MLIWSTVRSQKTLFANSWMKNYLHWLKDENFQKSFSTSDSTEYEALMVWSGESRWKSVQEKSKRHTASSSPFRARGGELRAAELSLLRGTFVKGKSASRGPLRVIGAVPPHTRQQREAMFRELEFTWDYTVLSSNTLLINLHFREKTSSKYHFGCRLHICLQLLFSFRSLFILKYDI